MEGQAGSVKWTVQEKARKQGLAKPEWSRTMSDLRGGGHHQSNMMFKGPEVIKRKKKREEYQVEIGGC